MCFETLFFGESVEHSHLIFVCAFNLVLTRGEAYEMSAKRKTDVINCIVVDWCRCWISYYLVMIYYLHEF